MTDTAISSQQIRPFVASTVILNRTIKNRIFESTADTYTQYSDLQSLSLPTGNTTYKFIDG